MLDGVEWAAAEIVFYMLLATLIGFAIAYVFIRWFQKGSAVEGHEAELAAQKELARKAEQRLVESNDALGRLELNLRGEQQRAGDLEAQLEAARSTIADLEAAVPDEGAMARLQADLGSSRSAEEKSAARIAELEEALAAGELAAAQQGETLAQLERDLDSSRTAAESLRSRVADLESTIATKNARIAELEQRIAELHEQRATEGPADASDSVQMQPRDEDGPSQEEGLERIAEIAARTAGDGPVADDDLKKVHGIGPKLERTLKDLGITSFRQIARFEQDDIAYVTAALDAFKGRIERDDWMGSAAAEHAKKYGEPA